MVNNNYMQKVEESVSFLSSIFSESPKTIVQLGTGLGSLADAVDNAQIIPYAEIPHFPLSTVESHRGNLIIGKICGQSVAVLQGRVHCYEGYSAREVAFAIRVLSLLGASNLLLTNAAGGLNPLFVPGTIMVLRDHLNFLGDNPLRGPNAEKWGPRFPDLSTPYDPALIQHTFDAATRCNLTNVVSGVYACVPGPSLETPAETRWLRSCGADAVGMSSVPEVIVAIHAGMRVLGLSAISNVNNPDNFQPILLEEILAASEKVGPQLISLIKEIFTHL